MILLLLYCNVLLVREFYLRMYSNGAVVAVMSYPGWGTPFESTDFTDRLIFRGEKHFSEGTKVD